MWSAGLTTPLAARIPRRWFAAALTIIKTVHTAAFFSIAGSIIHFTWDGFRGRRLRRTEIAGAAAVAETMIFGGVGSKHAQLARRQIHPSRA